MLHLLSADNMPDELNVSPGDEIEVQLEEVPTTGYKWTQEGQPNDFLSMTKSDLALHDTAVAGGGGKRTFRFRVTGEGQSTLSFTNRRPWGGEPAAQSQIKIISAPSK